MKQTTIMSNLRKVYFKNDVIDSINPFYLTILLYKNYDQFMKDKDARKMLLANTLEGISNLRFLTAENAGYYMISNFGKIPLDMYMELSKEIVETMLEKGWKQNIVMRGVDTLVNSNMTRKVIYSYNYDTIGTNSDKYTKEMYEKEMKEYLVKLDAKYTKYIVDDII